MKFRITRGWAGRLPNGFRLGLLGVLARNEADVAASGIFNRINRFAEFDIVHQSWKFHARFIFRIDSDSVSFNPKIFLTPFDYPVWGAIFLVSVLILVLKRFFEKSEQYFLGKILKLKSRPSYINLNALIGSYCQQGFSPIPDQTVYRTLILFILITSLMLYNYYTSSIVGALLSSPIKGPETFEEVLSSPISLMFEDIGYNKIMIREQKTNLIKTMVTKKVKSRSPNSSIPIYVSVEKAIPFLKKGGIALHCEATEVYDSIALKLDANEICDLRTVDGPLETSMINFNLPKKSQYLEAFKIG